MPPIASTHSSNAKGGTLQVRLAEAELEQKREEVERRQVEERMKHDERDRVETTV